jgi:hypothetical protein
VRSTRVPAEETVAAMRPVLVRVEARAANSVVFKKCMVAAGIRLTISHLPLAMEITILTGGGIVATDR